MKGGGRMNIREFAALCGVAHSTVSRVLNQPWETSRTSRITYDRIRAKAAEVGFQVNYYAQALHSKNSNCLGLIIGGWMQSLTESLLYGVSNTLDLQDKHLSVITCDETLKSEADAFEKMLVYNAEAVLYIPTRQAGRNYAIRHIRKVLEKYLQYPPVITLYGGTGIPEFYQIGFHDYETGSQAALRQLRNGCRKFGLIQTFYRHFMFREMARGYRETLRKKGIPASQIKELFFWNEGFSSAAFDELREVDGIWCSHYVLLLHCIPQMIQMGVECKRLHVDTICGMEMLEMYRNLQPSLQGGEPKGNFPDWFDSLMVYQYNVRDVGIMAAEITLQLSRKNKDEIPKRIYLELTPCLKGNHNAEQETTDIDVSDSAVLEVSEKRSILR